MEKDRKFRALAIAAICVAIVGVSVAYAALSASLSITGTAKVNTENAWKIQWTNLQSKEDATASTAVTINSLNITSAEQNVTWSADFAAPKSTMTFTVKLTNGGTIPAKLVGMKDVTVTEKIIKSSNSVTGSEILDNAFTYTVMGKTSTTEWKDISTFENWVLPAGKSLDVQVTVKFDEQGDITDLTDYNGKSAEFRFDIPAIQADDADVSTATTNNTLIG